MVLWATAPLAHGRQWDQNKSSREEGRARPRSDPKFGTTASNEAGFSRVAGFGKRARNCSVGGLKIGFAGGRSASASRPLSLGVTGWIYRSEMGNYHHASLSSGIPESCKRSGLGSSPHAATLLPRHGGNGIAIRPLRCEVPCLLPVRVLRPVLPAPIRREFILF